MRTVVYAARNGARQLCGDPRSAPLGAPRDQRALLRRARCFPGAAFGMVCALVLLPGAGAMAQARVGAPAAHPHTDAHPGYLGVSLVDIDADTAARQHLKDLHGALIVTIDREAPAASAGLRPRDVIVEMSGQRLDNVDGLRRKLRETSAGSTITLRISRDGAEQSVSVQLGDEAEIARSAWERHFSSAPDSSPAGDAADPGNGTASGPPAAIAGTRRRPAWRTNPPG